MLCCYTPHMHPLGAMGLLALCQVATASSLRDQARGLVV